MTGQFIEQGLRPSRIAPWLAARLALAGSWKAILVDFMAR
jgi:hypothetical protein